MKKWVRNLMLWALALTLGVSLAFAEEGSGGGSDPGDGGTATCIQKAVCDVCKQEYGDYAPHDYSGRILHDANGHWYVCAVCNKNSETERHSGGTATCK